MRRKRRRKEKNNNYKTVNARASRKVDKDYALALEIQPLSFVNFFSMNMRQWL
jgi:hypothetical protein